MQAEGRGKCRADKQMVLGQLCLIIACVRDKCTTQRVVLKNIAYLHALPRNVTMGKGEGLPGLFMMLCSNVNALLINNALKL